MNNPYDIVISNNNNATSFVELNDQYNALYNLLVNNQREISYLDLYKITEYINTTEDKAQIGSKFAQLNPNTAIGIGVPSINFNGETFYQGDLLLKLSNGQMQKLDAPSHGIYFPSIKNRTKTLDDGTETTVKSIIWNYSKDEPVEGTSSALENNNSAKWSLYWDIPNVNNSNGYGQKITSFTTSMSTNLFSDISIIPIISGETITYNGKTIVERKEDNKLYYYLFNLPNNCGIRIREENLVCYITEDKTQTFLSNKFVYYSENNFITTEDQKEFDSYLTIDWNGENWITTYTYNKRNVVLNFSGENIKYNNEIIVERVGNLLYYYLYNLPNHFGIRIKDKNVCYKEDNNWQEEISSNSLVYRNEDQFITTEDREESDNYFTIDWNENGYWDIINIIQIQSTTINHINGLTPIIKCFNKNNEEVLANITTTLSEDSTKYTISNIPSCVNYLMIR